MRCLFTILVLSVCTVIHAQKLDKLFVNAEMNPNYSSSFIVDQNSNILEKDVNKWLVKNKNNFENINDVKVIFTQKWYWGSKKTVLKSMFFVKRDHVANRNAYLERLRIKGQRDAELQQQAKALIVGGVALGIGYIYSKKDQIKEWYLDGFKYVPADNISNYEESKLKNSDKDNAGNKSKENNPVKEVKLSCEEKTLTKYENISIRKTSEWESYSGILTSFNYSQLITFSDGNISSVFKNSKDNFFGIQGFLGVEIFYKTYDDAVRALYIYKVCGVATNKGLK